MHKLPGNFHVCKATYLYGKVVYLTFQKLNSADLLDQELTDRTVPKEVVVCLNERDRVSEAARVMSLLMSEERLPGPKEHALKGTICLTKPEDTDIVVFTSGEVVYYEDLSPPEAAEFWRAFSGFYKAKLDELKQKAT